MTTDTEREEFRSIFPGRAAIPIAVRPPAVRSDPFGATDSNVVFFGNSLSVECQRCGAFCSTSIGHKYCTHVTCPIALREFKRRKRKRTSTLEQVYMPQIKAKREGSPDEPAEAGPQLGL